MDWGAIPPYQKDPKHEVYALAILATIYPPQQKSRKPRPGQRGLLAIVPNWVVSGEITAVCTARGG